MKQRNEVYLGDGVYADEQRGMLRLTSRGGVSILNEIFFEPDVLDALFKYIERTRHLKITKIPNSDSGP